MNGFWQLVLWFSSVIIAYLMAESRGYDKRWAVVGGLLFGWGAPLYYLIRGKKIKAD